MSAKNEQLKTPLIPSQERKNSFSVDDYVELLERVQQLEHRVEEHSVFLKMLQEERQHKALYGDRKNTVSLTCDLKPMSMDRDTGPGLSGPLVKSKFTDRENKHFPKF